MHNKPTRRPEPRRRRGVVRISAAAVVAVAALGYVVSDLDRSVLAASIRLAAAISVIVLVIWINDARTTMRLEQIRADLQELKREHYWRVYADLYADVSGIGSDEDSTDSGHLPPRR